MKYVGPTSPFVSGGQPAPQPAESRPAKVPANAPDPGPGAGAFGTVSAAAGSTAPGSVVLVCVANGSSSCHARGFGMSRPLAPSWGRLRTLPSKAAGATGGRCLTVGPSGPADGVALAPVSAAAAPMIAITAKEAGSFVIVTRPRARSTPLGLRFTLSPCLDGVWRTPRRGVQRRIRSTSFEAPNRIPAFGEFQVRFRLAKRWVGSDGRAV